MPTFKTGDPLVGKWFHSFNDNGSVRWQGQILSAVREGYLVQLYEWMVGTPTLQRVVLFTDVLTWQLYDTNEAMIDTYERTLKDRPPS